MRDDDIERELREHLEMEAEERRAEGLTPQEAQRRARVAFGSISTAREDTRAVWRWTLIESFVQDLRYGARMLRRNPGFTAVAMLSLAFGIGSTSAVFSVVDQILFRSLPYAQDERLVSFGITMPHMPYEFLMGAMYAEVRRPGPVFDGVTSWSAISDCDLTENSPLRLSCGLVSWNFLSVLGVPPLIGRGFHEDEDAPNAPRTVILSHAVWTTHFGGDPAIAGKTFSLDGNAVRVVGVLPQGFEMPSLAAVDMLVPQGADEATLVRAVTGRPVWAIGRLKACVGPLEAQAILRAQFLSSLSSVPAPIRKDIHFRMRTLRDRQFGDSYTASWLLLASVIAVMLIACANVANLLLARLVSRRKEMAMRAAIGASRSRLMRQTLTESLLLAMAGGIAGVALAQGLLRLFLTIAPEGIPRLRDASVDGRLLLFTLFCSLAAGIVFGSTPAFETPNAGRGSRGRLRHMLVGAQIALCLVLLTSASLLLRTLWNLQSASFGMKAESVMTTSLSLGRRIPQRPRQLAFWEELEDRLANLPGVTSVAIADSLPPNNPARSRPFHALEVDGRPIQTPGFGGAVVWRAVSPGYFQALGIPIVEGRGFANEDRAPNVHRMVLSLSLARALFRNASPIGKRIRVGSDYEVIGVARDVRNAGAGGQDDPEYYVVRSRSADDGIYAYPDSLTRASLLVRGALSADAIRAEIAAIDRSLPVNMESMEQRVQKLAIRPRFQAFLLAFFAGVSLSLAAVGLYGVVSFLVVQRTREIGIRMALGATRAAVVRHVLGKAAAWVAGGTAAGLILSLAVTRVLRSFLFGVSDKDPGTFGVAFGVMVLVTLLASWGPAVRASTVDPSVALRNE